MCACIFMPSPFLEGCPKILITTVLVSKTETGTEFYNYLTLFLKCSINLPSFIVKKKKKTSLFKKITLKRALSPLLSFPLSDPSRQRNTTSSQEQWPGPKRPERGVKENGCSTVLSIFAYFSQKYVFLFSPLQLRKGFRLLENPFRRYTRQQVEPRSVRCRAPLPPVKPTRRAPVLPAGRKKLLQSETVYPRTMWAAMPPFPLSTQQGPGIYCVTLIVPTLTLSLTLSGKLFFPVKEMAEWKKKKKKKMKLFMFQKRGGKHR